MSRIFQADADQLYEVSSFFYANGELIDETMRDLGASMEELRANWEGRGANAFFDEMEGLVAPFLRATFDAMALSTEQVNQLMKQTVDAERTIRGRLMKQS